MQKYKRLLQRKKRVRAKLPKKEGRLRLSVFRSSKYIYAQIIDDIKGETLVSFSSRQLSREKTAKENRTEIARTVGEELAKRAKKAKITKVVFDRAGYKYQGKVKALAEGARKGGLEF
ncbi:MAG: 50S ribosomal protein L18 [Microgenomates group bacterium]